MEMRIPKEIIGMPTDEALKILEKDYYSILTDEDLVRIAEEEIGDYPITIRVGLLPPREDFYGTKHSREGKMEAFLSPIKTKGRYLGDAELILHSYLKWAEEDYVRDVVRHELKHYRTFRRKYDRSI